MVHTEDPVMFYTQVFAIYEHLGVTFYIQVGAQGSRERQFGSQGVGFYIHFMCGVLQQG